MATTLSTQLVTTSGVTPSLAAVDASGNNFANSGSTLRWVQITNSDGVETYDVTFVTGATFGGEPVADRTVTIGTSTTKLIGPFDPEVFNDSSGLVNITYSGSAPATDLTIQVFGIRK